MKDILSNDYGHCHYCVCANEDCSMIYNLFVEEKHRRKGYAKSFVIQAIDEIRKTGYLGDIKIVAEPESESISKEELIKFYEKMSLKVI